MEALLKTCLAELTRKDADSIRAYWKDCGVNYKTCDNPEITKLKLKKSRLACVGGPGVLHIFYFHEKVIAHASENIKKSLIKHELAHCWDFSRKPCPKVFPLEYSSLSWSESLIRQSSDAAQEILSQDLDERIAIQKNLEWGSDESAIDEWARLHF